MDDRRALCIKQLFGAKRGELTARPEEHECCKDRSDVQAFCNPENESALVERGALHASMATGLTDIYVCRRWNVHQCTADKCTLWHATGYCPLTGMVHGGVMVDDLRNQEVHSVKQLTRGGLMKRAKVNRVDSNTVHIKREAVTLAKISSDYAGQKRKAAPTEEQTAAGDEDINTLGLLLLEALEAVALPNTMLKKRLTAALHDKLTVFNGKVRKMVSDIQMNYTQTRFPSDSVMQRWLKTRISEYHAGVRALKREVADVIEAGKGYAIKSRRKLVSSANMFGTQAVVVEEHVDLELERQRAEEAAKRKRDEREALKSQSRRRKDGSLIIAVKRDEDIYECDMDGVHIAPVVAQLETQRAREARIRAEALSHESVDRFKKRAKKIIVHLLYGNPRKEVLKRHETEMARVYYTAVRKYTKKRECEPSWLEKMEIGYNTQRDPPIAILEYDADLVDKYVEIVTHVWRVVVKYEQTVFANAGERVCLFVTLATLYSVRDKGVSARGITFVPRSSQMLNLPRIGDLKHFKLDEHKALKSYGRSYTQGCNIVQSAFEAALDAGCAPETLRVDLSVLKAKKVRTGDLVHSDAVEMFPVGKGHAKRSNRKRLSLASPRPVYVKKEEPL